MLWRGEAGQVWDGAVRWSDAGYCQAGGEKYGEEEMGTFEYGVVRQSKAGEEEV